MVLRDSIIVFTDSGDSVYMLITISNRELFVESYVWSRALGKGAWMEPIVLSETEYKIDPKTTRRAGKIQKVKLFVGFRVKSNHVDVCWFEDAVGVAVCDSLAWARTETK